MIGHTRRELVARHLDVRDARVRERLEAGVVLGARVPERDELVASPSWLYCSARSGMGPVAQLVFKTSAVV